MAAGVPAYDPTNVGTVQGSQQPMPAGQPMAQQPPMPVVGQQQQQTPGGLYGSIGQTQYQPQGAGSTNNNANYNMSMGGGMSGGLAPIGSPSQNNNATQWNTNNGRVDTGVDAFRQFGDQYYDHTMGRLAPQMQAQEERSRQSLINRGLQPGTDAYNAEMTLMNQRNNDMMSSTALGAEQLGLQAQNQYFGQESQNNQYDLAQNQANYGQQFGYDQLANALQQSRIGASATTAAAGASAAASRYGADQQNYRADLANQLGYSQLNEQGRQYDIGNITQNQLMDQNYSLGLGNLFNNFQNTGINQALAQNQLDTSWWNQGSSYAGAAPGAGYTGVGNTTGQMQQAGNSMANAQAQQNQGVMGLLGGLIGLSDARLKENIEHVDNVDGVDVYEFDYLPEVGISGRFRGVMAQEIMTDYPDAVIDVGGFYAVDYSQLPVNMEVVQ